MKNHMMRVKIEFEDIPLIDSKSNVKNSDDFDREIGMVKRKLFGK